MCAHEKKLVYFFVDVRRQLPRATTSSLADAIQQGLSRRPELKAAARTKRQ